MGSKTSQKVWQEQKHSSPLPESEMSDSKLEEVQMTLETSHQKKPQQKPIEFYLDSLNDEEIQLNDSYGILNRNSSPI